MPTPSSSSRTSLRSMVALLGVQVASLVRTAAGNPPLSSLRLPRFRVRIFAALLSTLLTYARISRQDLLRHAQEVGTERFSCRLGLVPAPSPHLTSLNPY